MPFPGPELGFSEQAATAEGLGVCGTYGVSVLVAVH